MAEQLHFIRTFLNSNESCSESVRYATLLRHKSVNLIFAMDLIMRRLREIKYIYCATWCSRVHPNDEIVYYDTWVITSKDINYFRLIS